MFVMNQPHTPFPYESASDQVMSEAALRRDMVLNTKVPTGKENLPWIPNLTQQSGDTSNGSIFHDRHEPRFEKYVTDFLQLPAEATDDDIRYQMTLHGQAADKITLNPHEWPAQLEAMGVTTESVEDLTSIG